MLAFTDGKAIEPMVSSMDHKRALDGDKGLNTGGMGTIAPNPYYTDDMAAQLHGGASSCPPWPAMQAEGCPFKGCLYFGLMLTPDGPKVIEYNCRFGDPETQVVLPLLESRPAERSCWPPPTATLDRTWRSAVEQGRCRLRHPGQRRLSASPTRRARRSPG